MRELSVVAENLRLVQRARRHFLDMWSVEHGVINPMLDRMVDELHCAIGGPEDPADDEGKGFTPPDPGGDAN